MSPILKFLAWSFAAALSLLVLGIAYVVYPVFSFDTQRLPKNHGSVRTELFLGAGESQPLIVGFGGAEGGNTWAEYRLEAQRDELLAQGYAFLAVGYFGMEGTPEELDRIALEGVHAAVLEAAGHARIDGRCIGLVGGSKGGELALVLASHYPAYKAVVAGVPGHAVFAGHTRAMTASSWSLDGEAVPFVPVPWSAAPALIRGDLRAAFERMLENETAVERAAIEVENINGPILLLSATQDEFWPSTWMSERIVARLQAHAFPHYFEHMTIRGEHSEPLKRLDEVSRFLNAQFLPGAPTGCPRP